MSHYADYRYEREGKHTLELEYGFAVYSVDGEWCYLEDIYVEPDQRRFGKGKRLNDLIEKIAKGYKCKYMLGSISPSVKGSQESLLALIGAGYKLYSSKPDMIYFKKDL